MEEILIPVCKPVIGTEEEHRILKVLRSGQLAAGTEVAALEKNLRLRFGREAIAVSSGTAALIALTATSELPKGSHVAVPALTFAASATCLLLNGLVPVFLDVEPDSFNINPEALLEACRQHPLKAVIVVHLYGQMADMHPLMDIARQHSLLIIEDCAQAPGAIRNNKPAGTWGHAAAFSFYATKNLTSGEGGAVLVDDSRWAQRIKEYISHGQRERYHHVCLGQNYRMSEMQAALANCQLEKLDDFNSQRRRIAQKYRHLLECVPIGLPSETIPGSHVYHQYTIRSIHRDALQHHLTANGIGTGIHYPRPLYRQPVFNQYKKVVMTCPVTESLCPTILSLPMYPVLTDEQVELVANRIKKFFDQLPFSAKGAS